MDTLSEKAKLLRKWILKSTTAAGSGHPTSCLSAVELMTVLFDHFYTFDIKNTKNLNNDRLIFSKGHAAPLLYTLYAASGAYPFEQLLSLRQFDSIFQGHPMPDFPYTEVATGSLGQGLSIGAGMALGLRKISNKLIRSPKVYVLLGDGEVAEGQVWEAFNFASKNKLNNLIAIIDVNRLGQSEPTMFDHDLSLYSQRIIACGWNVIEVDGHNLIQIHDALTKAMNSTMPVAIIAKTIKGKGVSLWEDKEGFHAKVLSPDQLMSALSEIGETKDEIVFHLPAPDDEYHIPSHTHISMSEPLLSAQETYMTKQAYSEALVHIAQHNRNLIVIDGDMQNSTTAEIFAEKYPEQFIQGYIAEQNAVGVATGLSHIGFTVFFNTFASFLTRAFDQLRMANISQIPLHIVGTYVGVSAAHDGASQMGIEDIAMMGSLRNISLFSPSDIVSAEKMINLVAENNTMSYIRLSRTPHTILYKASDEFALGGSHVLRRSDQDELTLVSTGDCLHNALNAADLLMQEGICIRVIDCYSIIPIDKNTLSEAIMQTKQKRIIVVEDHGVYGGLADHVCEALGESGAYISRLGVTHTLHSGDPKRVFEDAQIDPQTIVSHVKNYLS